VYVELLAYIFTNSSIVTQVRKESSKTTTGKQYGMETLYRPRGLGNTRKLILKPFLGKQSLQDG